MKKRKKKSPRQEVYAEDERAYRELTNMKHKDVQRACILRGLEFSKVVGLDHHALVSWFINNYDNSQDNNLLIQFDLWVEEELKAKGYKEGDTLMSPALRYSYNGDIEAMEKPKIIKPIAIAAKPEKKQKSEIDTVTGVRTGTKKSLTYQLTLDKMNILDIVKKVKEAFPNAEEKSIKIWNKRKLKEMDEAN